MIDQLFGSKTRVKLLQLFFTNPNRPYYVREITRKIEEQINSVRRELANLLDIGIISSENTNNRLYYEVNQTYQYYPALSVMFGGAKASGSTSKKAKAVQEEDQNISDEFKALGHVELVIYTGQFTRDESSGVDLLIAGDVNQKQLQKFINELEQKEAKEVRYTVMPIKEFHYRQQVNDRFLNNILSSKKQVAVDRQNILSKNKKPTVAETIKG